MRVYSDQAIWRGMFAALDVAGEVLSSQPVRGLDEVDAIVASCLRYGSYFHTLTCGLSHEWSEDETRITDSEMRCINIEFSAAIAQWWRDKEDNPERVNRRVRAALLLLPTPWRGDRDYWYARWPDLDAREENEMERYLEEQVQVMLASGQESEEKAAAIDELLHLDVREEANRAAMNCWRNGPIEKFHHGFHVPATELPGYCRFSEEEATEIMRYAAYSLPAILQEHYGCTPHIRALMLKMDRHFSKRWTLTEDTAEVRYTTTENSDMIREHLLKVRSCCPEVFESSKFP